MSNRLTVEPVYEGEYVAGGVQDNVLAMRRVLPELSELQHQRGPDIYDRMMLDPAAGSSVETLALQTLADGVTLRPAVEQAPEAGATPQDVADYDGAQRYYEFLCRGQEALEDSGTDIYDVSLQLLMALSHRNRCAEKILRYVDSGPDRGLYQLDRLAAKHPHNIGYIVDPYWRPLGVVAVEPGVTYTAMHGMYLPDDVTQVKGFLPLDKFVFYRRMSLYGTPLGESVLDRAYNAVRFKNDQFPEYFKYLKQFGTPLIVGKTPPGSTEEIERDRNGNALLDSSGQPMRMTPERKMLNSLLDFMNSTALVAPGGSEIDLVASTGEGKAFLDAFGWLDRQIATAILGTTRATMEAEHGAKADSQVGQDILGIRVSNIRRSLESTLNRDVSRWLIRLNFGADAVRLAPRFNLSKVEQEDKAKMIAALSQARASGLILDSQLPFIWRLLGWDAGDMEELMQAKQESALNARLASGELGKLQNPAGDQVEDPKAA